MPLEGVLYRHTKEQRMGCGGHERRRMSPEDPLDELVFTAVTNTLWPKATSGRKADSGLRFPRRMSPRYQESMGSREWGGDTLNREHEAERGKLRSSQGLQRRTSSEKPSHPLSTSWRPRVQSQRPRGTFSFKPIQSFSKPLSLRANK